jgi:hypothetical protein
MLLRDLKQYIYDLEDDSEFVISVRSIETGKVFALSYAVAADINYFDELQLSIDVEMCLGCPLLKKYDWRKNDAARCVASYPYSLLSFNTMRKRRASVKSVITLLEAIHGAQLNALENTPINFRDSDNFETGDIAADVLEDAIDILKDVY